MQLRLGLACALSALSLAGCSSLGINNGSLDYKNTTSVEPLKYPEGSTVRPATPMYPAPIVDPLALKHAPVFENKRGNRYEVPRPEVEKSSATANETTTSSESVGRPQLLTDGNSATIWQYTLATLSSLNHKLIGKSKNANEATVKIDNSTYVLKLSSVGSSNTIAVFNADNSFADKEKSAQLLTQIYQNWPA